jgi:Skp family chaperone for outer membrane proteins
MTTFRDVLQFISDQTKRSAEFLVLAGFAAAIVALASADPKSTQSQWLFVLGGLIATTGTGMIALVYLQQARRRSPPDLQKLRNELRDMSHEVAKLKDETKNVTNFTPEERQDIVSDVKANLSQEAVTKIASIWVQEFKEKSADREHESRFLEIGESLVDRLQDEISALGRRANVNLVIGILVSGLGLVALTWFVVSVTSELSAGVRADDAAVRFIVRLSLAIFIQVFAYFFLRLYRYSIFEIKYFQNEITGAQFKLLALVSALQVKDKNTVGKLCLELAKTERNFILKKGETTAALQRDDIERAYEDRLFAMVERVAGGERKAGK